MEDIVRSIRVIRQVQARQPSTFSSYRIKERTEMPNNMVLHLTYDGIDTATSQFLKQMLQFGDKKQICMKTHNMDMYIAIKGSRMRLKVIAHRNVELYRMIFQFAMGIVQHYQNALTGKNQEEASKMLLAMMG